MSHQQGTIPISNNVSVNENEIHESFIRASGHGGQNVNKVATAVQLRFDVVHSLSLPEEVRSRLARLARKRINSEGELIIEAQEFRTQEQNRQAARARLVRLIRQAEVRPRVRVETRPTAAAKERRLESKRRQSEIKKRRRAARRERE